MPRFRTHSNVLAAAIIIAATVGLTPTSIQAAPICGPGAHWVDTCTAGLDTFDSVATVGIDFNFDAVVDQTIVLSGPTTVMRSGPLDDSLIFPGTRPVDAHSDVIDTEIVSMQLVGAGPITLTAGAGLGTSVLPPSLGAIAEDPGDPALAFSFFDVFVELDVGGGLILVNQQALRVEALITEVPPLGIPYIHPLPGPIVLFDLQGAPAAQLINVIHKPIPAPATISLFAAGLIGVAFARRRRAL